MYPSLRESLLLRGRFACEMMNAFCCFKVVCALIPYLLFRYKANIVELVNLHAVPLGLQLGIKGKAAGRRG